jgi:diguanylate cyclase (GGDEF)-like protein
MRCAGRAVDDVGVDAFELLDDVAARLPGDPVVGALRLEVQALAEEVARLRAAAGHDPVTGVANRASLEDALKREASRCRRSGEPLSLVVLDVERVDTEDPEVADAVLRAAAEAWTFQLRASDLVARIDEDDFAVLLPGAAREDAAELTERLRIVMPPDTHVSAGVAQLGDDEQADALFSRAGQALFEARAAGRDEVRIAA